MHNSGALAIRKKLFQAIRVQSIKIFTKSFSTMKMFNPLVPSAHKSVWISKISILKLEGIIKKISYERRDYESVDENSLSEAMSRKTTKRRIQALKGERKWKFTNLYNPLVPSAHKSVWISKILILKLEGIIKKISYERRDYVSVDENSLSEAMSQKTTKRRIQALKG